jgi:hypothetical protein
MKNERKILPKILEDRYPAPAAKAVQYDRDRRRRQRHGKTPSKDEKILK